MNQVLRENGVRGMKTVALRPPGMIGYAFSLLTRLNYKAFADSIFQTSRQALDVAFDSSIRKRTTQVSNGR